ncbi:DUF4097 family beta strand repeat-containing protein [Paenibacillus sp.]|uniref:DUF4097 family beta strand repeat-containing protein n=1 Tax=Paenibacillus sp. TaxID=58172 RepID=UPI002811E861|nr:DUF4097 family beta strand repeat-containing protein [Paenibacillus sp.]
MTFRKKRLVILSSVAVLFCLLVLDLWVKKEEMFEAFGSQFLHAAKTNAYDEAHRDVTVAAERQLTIDGQGVKEVLLAGDRGKISVRRAEASQIELRYTVTAVGRNEASAKERAEDAAVEEKVEAGRLTLTPSAESDAVTIDYVLSIPDGTKLRVESEDGSIDIRGTTGDVEVTSVRGKADVVDVVGQVSAKAVNGHAYLADVRGNVDLSNEYGSATIESVEGAVTLGSRSGDTYLSRIEGAVSGNVNGGSVRFDEISGPVAVTGTEAALRLERIRNDVRLDAESGQIRLILSEAEGYAVNATVIDGWIQAPPSLPVEADPAGTHEARAQGVVGSGAWNMDVRAVSTDVVIHVK